MDILQLKQIQEFLLSYGYKVDLELVLNLVPSQKMDQSELLKMELNKQDILGIFRDIWFLSISL